MLLKYVQEVENVHLVECTPPAPSPGRVKDK